MGSTFGDRAPDLTYPECQGHRYNEAEKFVAMKSVFSGGILEKLEEVASTKPRLPFKTGM